MERKNFTAVKLVAKKGAQCSCQVYILKPHDSYESYLYSSGEHTHLAGRNAINNAEIRKEIMAWAWKQDLSQKI